MGLLVMLALAGLALMGAVDFWTLQRQREREQQLLFVGDAYRQAIRHYYFGAPPGAPRSLPTRLEALLDDERYPMPVHHLRRLYADPLRDSTEWGELRVGNAIAGVYSLSDARPVKQAGFAAADSAFTGKASYREWIFAFAEAPGLGGALAAAGTTPLPPAAAPSTRPAPGSKP
jgi:type II secretory pathway pseudopilin PulG